MALSWLDQFPASARLAYPGIVRGVREGLSARAIGRALRAGGLTFADRFLFAAVRLERDVFAAGQVVSSLGDRQRPDPARLPEALHAIQRRYSFLVEVEGDSLSTGERIRQHVTISTDRLLTRREMEDAAIDAVESLPSEYGMEDVEATAIFGVKAGRQGIL
jgi:hypothetical protein